MCSVLFVSLVLEKVSTVSMCDEDTRKQLRKTARQLARPGSGILASDESPNTIGKRLEKHGIENTAESRRKYRSLFYSAPIGGAISGAILFPEALEMMTDDGVNFVKALHDQGVLVGVKVDQGLDPMSSFISQIDNGVVVYDGETCTKGLESLAERLKVYKEKGATFAKWRAAIRICKLDDGTYDSSKFCIDTNAEQLALYAKACQQEGIVPIVEPEILIDGDHTMAVCEKITTTVLQQCIFELWNKGIDLEGILLKPQMVVPGVDCQTEKYPDPTDVATTTLRVLRGIVPPSVPGIMFLSGGQTEYQATQNLNMLNVVSKSSEEFLAPWSLSFSFGRGLQASVLSMWSDRGPGSEEECKALAGEIARVNGAATLGGYECLMNHPTIMPKGGNLQEEFRGHY